MKILIVINEDFEKTILGKNTTLAYALAAVELSHDVFIYKISTTKKIPDPKKDFNVIWLNKFNATELVKKYKIENFKIVKSLSQQQNQGYSDISVADFCIAENFSLTSKSIFLKEIDFVIQRLEPMKAPFPPVGKISIEDFLVQFKKLFAPNFIFNFPCNAYRDKELPLVLSGESNLATPTAISFYGDKELPSKLQKIAIKYSEIFASNQKKIVIKPDDSAQALGVFAIEISENGLDLTQLKEKNIAQLSKIQLYEIRPDKSWSDVIEIINILCFVQFCKTKSLLDQRKISEISPQEIATAIHSLYGKKILLQPFLEGVRSGDIRINLAKMADGNFKVVGAVFRKSISFDEENFTTCLTAGASKAQFVEDFLTIAEKQNLLEKIHFILQNLNHNEVVKSKYRDVTEIGCDFLIVGNSREVYFGEANHYCQALIPFSESLERAKKSNFYDEINGLRVDYDGGLATISQIIKQQIALQNQ